MSTDPRVCARCPRCGDAAIDHRLDRHWLRCRHYAANHNTASAAPLPAILVALVRAAHTANTPPELEPVDQPSLFGAGTERPK